MGDTTRSLARVVYQHVQNDMENMSKEKSILVKFKIITKDENLQDQRSDAANNFSANFSHQMTEKSEKENQDGQYYTFIKMTDLSEEQFRDGVVKTWDVHCRSCLNYNNPPP